MATPDELYFVKDFVTEEVTSIGIGECWLYFYKETFIGVRHRPTAVSFFVDAKTKGDSKANMAPTLENLTEAHVKEAIDEIDPNAEAMKLLPLLDIGGKGIELLMLELSSLIDKRLTGKHD